MRLKLLLLLAATFLLYASFLERSPVYLNNDEAAFALQAHAIATTARDEHGRLLPLYFNILPGVWYHPVIVYVMALFLTVLPLTEWSVRLPTVVLAVANVGLVVVLARRVFRRENLALLAGGLLALTPSHFIHGRLACDYLYPVPFILVWLIALTSYLERPRLWLLFVAGLALGVGFYSYLASVVSMPMYVALTCAVLATTERKPIRPCRAVAASFLVALVPLTLWLSVHPDTLFGTVGRYRTHTELQSGLLTNLGERAMVFVKFFNPAYLFARDFGAVTSSTHRAGVFAAAMAIFLPVGVYQIISRRRSPLTLLLIAGFVLAPLAATIVNEPYTTDRAIALLPLGVLIGACGVERLWMSGVGWLRGATIALLISIPVQFVYFYYDYLTDYRRRSGFWFNGNNRGALEEIIAANPPGNPRTVYFAYKVPFIQFYWKLYLLKHHREDLLAHTEYFDVETLDADAVPADAIILTNSEDVVERTLIASGRFAETRKIPEADDSTAFALLEKRR